MDGKMEKKRLRRFFGALVTLSLFFAASSGCGTSDAPVDDPDVDGIDIDAPADGTGRSRIELIY